MKIIATLNACFLSALLGVLLYREAFPANLSGCSLKSFHLTNNSTFVQTVRPVLKAFWESDFAPQSCGAPSLFDEAINFVEDVGAFLKMAARNYDSSYAGHVERFSGLVANRIWTPTKTTLHNNKEWIEAVTPDSVVHAWKHIFKPKDVQSTDDNVPKLMFDWMVHETTSLSASIVQSIERAYDSVWINWHTSGIPNGWYHISKSESSRPFWRSATILYFVVWATGWWEFYEKAWEPYNKFKDTFYDHMHRLRRDRKPCHPNHGCMHCNIAKHFVARHHEPPREFRDEHFDSLASHWANKQDNLPCVDGCVWCERVAYDLSEEDVEFQFGQFCREVRRDK